MNIHSWPSTNLDNLRDISLPDSSPKGTVTPNGLPWGHSPHDFFKVILPSSDPARSQVQPGDAIWSKSMIEEAWGKDIFAKGRLSEEEAADEAARELTPQVMRPRPVLGYANCRTSLPMHADKEEEQMKAELGAIDEGSDQFEMRVEGQHANGELLMDGKEMIKQIQDWVACLKCMHSDPAQVFSSISFFSFFLFPIDNGQEQCAESCTGSVRVGTTGGPEDTVLNGTCRPDELSKNVVGDEKVTEGVNDTMEITGMYIYISAMLSGVHNSLFFPSLSSPYGKKRPKSR